MYVVAKELEVHFDSCPYAQQSFRGEVSDLINKLSEKHPTIKYSTLRGYDKIKEAIGDGFKKLILSQGVKGVVNPQPTDYVRHVHF